MALSGMASSCGPTPAARAMGAIALTAAGATDIGGRAHNEDHVLLRPEIGLYLVADGAGGHNAGNVASALATTTAANVFESSAVALADRPEIDPFGLPTRARRLSSAIHRANAEIIEIAKRSAKYRGMGTTIVALAFGPTGEAVHVAHVGDSRCYRFRGGRLDALTTDHSLLVDILEGHPEVDDALLERAPRGAITRALGMEETLRVPVRSLRVAPGDVYLLCSDGLTAALDEAALEALLGEPRAPDAHVDALLQAALAAGAEDNLAAVVVATSVREGPRSSMAPPRTSMAPPSAGSGSVAPPSASTASPSASMAAPSASMASPQSRPRAAVAEPPRAPARVRMGSEPEIVIVGVETHVVPAAAHPQVLDVVGRLGRLRQPSSPEVAMPKPARCDECGQPFDAGSPACPTCGSRTVTAS